MKSASDGNSAPRDMLTLLVVSQIAGVSVKLPEGWAGCETDKSEYLHSESLYNLTWKAMETEADNADVCILGVEWRDVWFLLSEQSHFLKTEKGILNYGTINGMVTNYKL